MSATDPRPVDRSPDRTAFPRFELEYAVDDRREPREITIYDPLAPDRTTNWLTADVDDTVDLADVA